MNRGVEGYGGLGGAVLREPSMRSGAPRSESMRSWGSALRRHGALFLISHFSLLSSPLPLLRDLRDLCEKMPWRKLSRCTSAFACFAPSRELLLVYVVFGGVEAAAGLGLRVPGVVFISVRRR